MSHARKKFLAFAAAVVALPVTIASVAFACQVLATLEVNPEKGPAGTTVTATGGNYSTSTTATPVQIRLDSRTAPVIATTRPDANRRISVTFEVPAGTKAGIHAVLATQYLANGSPVAGTPGRDSFKVTSSGTVAASGGAASIRQLTPAAVGFSLALMLGVALVTRRTRSARS